PRRRGQLPDDAVHRGLLRLGHRPGAHGAQREGVGVEVGVAVHSQRDEESDDQGSPAEQPTDPNDHRAEQAEQQRRLQPVAVLVHVLCLLLTAVERSSSGPHMSNGSVHGGVPHTLGGAMSWLRTVLGTRTASAILCDGDLTLGRGYSPRLILNFGMTKKG